MDPRIGRTRTSVRQATLSLLGQVGYAAFTVEGVARESKVAKSTIYRHWPTKLSLISDSLEVLNQQPHPEISGTIREQIAQLIQHLVRVFDDSLFSACMPALIEAAAHHPEVAEFLHSYSAGRRQRLVDTIQRGIDSGELPPHLDAELAALALSAPIIYSRTMTPKAMTSRQASQLVEMILGTDNPNRRRPG
ncbi:MAG TPA: TetR/AcrR family transcriptional regulator [Acidimicrobiia bacterium]|nr:TetR/AcrR family transcriptional regulator [Acidimicrobiia bacterium]